MADSFRKRGPKGKAETKMGEIELIGGMKKDFGCQSDFCEGHMSNSFEVLHLDWRPNCRAVS
jgi:hypothetical protein